MTGPTTGQSATTLRPGPTVHICELRTARDAVSLINLSAFDQAISCYRPASPLHPLGVMKPGFSSMPSTVPSKRAHFLQSIAFDRGAGIFSLPSADRWRQAPRRHGIARRLPRSTAYPTMPACPSSIGRPGAGRGLFPPSLVSAGARYEHPHKEGRDEGEKIQLEIWKRKKSVSHEVCQAECYRGETSDEQSRSPSAAETPARSPFPAASS